jgi:hypothetical protein
VPHDLLYELTAVATARAEEAALIEHAPEGSARAAPTPCTATSCGSNTSRSRADRRDLLAHSNASDALRQYDFYRRHLADELGLAPSPRMRALLASLHETG